MLTVYEEKLLEDLRYKLGKALALDNEAVFEVDELTVLYKFLNARILEEKNDDLDTDKEFLEGVISDLENSLSDREDTIVDLKYELDLLDSNFHDLLTGNEILEEEVDELKEEVYELKEEVDELKEQLEEQEEE